MKRVLNYLDGIHHEKAHIILYSEEGTKLLRQSPLAQFCLCVLLLSCIFLIYMVGNMAITCSPIETDTPVLPRIHFQLQLVGCAILSLCNLMTCFVRYYPLEASGLFHPIQVFFKFECEMNQLNCTNCFACTCAFWHSISRLLKSVRYIVGRGNSQQKTYSS